MRQLDDSELACLNTIAHQASNTPVDCAQDVLMRLESLGLIEKVPGLWLPLEMMRQSWRLTAAGRAALRA